MLFTQTIKSCEYVSFEEPESSINVKLNTCVPLKSSIRYKSHLI